MIRQPLLLFLIASTFCASAQNSLGITNKLVFATYQYEENTRKENLEPLAKLVSELTDMTIEVKSYPSVQELLEGMEKNEVDVVLLNTAGYFLTKELEDLFEPVVQLSLPIEKQSEYRSIIAVGKHVQLPSLDEVLKESSDFVLVLVSPASTSGNLVPRLKLSSLQPGIPERFFLEVQYAGTHAEAMKRATTGEFALCAFGSSSYSMLGPDTTQFNVLWKSPPIPLGPVVFKKSLSGSLREQLENIFLDLHVRNPEVLQSIKDAWSEAASAERFMKVNPEGYDALLRLSPNSAVASFIVRSLVK